MTGNQKKEQAAEAAQQQEHEAREAASLVLEVELAEYDALSCTVKGQQRLLKKHPTYIAQKASQQKAMKYIEGILGKHRPELKRIHLKTRLRAKAQSRDPQWRSIHFAWKKWRVQHQCDRAARNNKVAAACHSVLILAEVKTAPQIWKTVVVIADTGSGPSIFRLVDVDTAVKEHGLQPFQQHLVTADGSALKGLLGSTSLCLRFPQATHPTSEYDLPSAIITEQSSSTPIIGVDFWARSKATFDFAGRSIVMPSSTGEPTTIPFWCNRHGQDTDTVHAAATTDAQPVTAATTDQDDWYHNAVNRWFGVPYPQWNSDGSVPPSAAVFNNEESLPEISVVARLAVDVTLQPGERPEQAFPVCIEEVCGAIHGSIPLVATSTVYTTTDPSTKVIEDKGACVVRATQKGACGTRHDHPAQVRR